MTIKRTYFLAFLAVFLLVTVSVAVSFLALQEQQNDALVINLAGRQRMLIQQMALEVLSIQVDANPAYRQALLETADEHFEKTLNALIAGGEAPYFDGATVTLPPTRDPEILAQLERVRAAWGELHGAIHIVLQADPQNAGFVEAAAEVERLSPILLSQMDEAVRLYQTSAERSVRQVQTIQFAFLTAIAALLLAVSVLTEGRVLRPIARLGEAAQRIGQGDLESPVAITGLGEIDWLARNLDRMRQRLSALVEAQAALLELSRRLLAANDEGAVAECAVEAAASTLHADFSALVMPDAEGRLLTRAVHGWPADFVGRFGLGQGDTSQTGYTILHGHPVVVEDYSTEMALAVPPTVSEYGIASGLSVPMFREGRVVGAMLVHSRTPRRFDDEETRVLSLIANQAAAALEKVRLLEAERRHLEELTVLYTLATSEAEATSVDALIKRAIQIVGDTLYPDYFGIGLVDEAANVLRICRSTRTGGEEFLTIPSGPGVAGRVIATGQPWRIPDVSREPAYLSVNPGTRSELCVPLKIGQRVIGTINAESTQLDAFSEAHERLMVTFARQLATAIEKVRLAAQTQQHLGELRLLHEASRALNADLSLEAVLDAVAAHFVTALEVESCTILGWNIERDEMVTLLDWDPELATRVTVGSRFRISEYAHYYALLREGQSLTFRRDDPALSDAFGCWLDTYRWRSLLAAPLINKGQVTGLVELGERRRERNFSADEIRLAESLAGQAAAAIDNARLHAKAERRADALHALREASRALTSDLHLEAVLQTLVETARRLVDVRYAALAVLKADGSLAHFYTAGITEAERGRIGRPPQGRGLLGVLLRDGVPIRLADLAHDPRSVGFPSHHPPMKTFMGVPIAPRRRVVGSLYFTDKADDQPFTQEDEDLAVGLAADAAIAIENARLFGEVQQLAITDSLTGLHNRRHFFEQAEREFQRARRYRRPLCAIMLDIDRFKQVNDTHGHAVGDQVLRAVSAHCRESLRDIDLLGRYGGDEFVGLLPEIDADGAHNAAERLRQRVAERPFDTDRGPVVVTISLGVASLENCSDLAMLINRADEAMYTAKKAGRNCTRVA